MPAQQRAAHMLPEQLVIVRDAIKQFGYHEAPNPLLFVLESFRANRLAQMQPLNSQLDTFSLTFRCSPVQKYSTTPLFSLPSQ